MEITRGYIHPVRNDIDYEVLKLLKRATLDLSVAPFVSAISDENIIDSFGLKCKLSLFDKINGYEVIGFTVESGVIFSRVGKQKEDLKLITDIVTDSFSMAMNYILDNSPDGFIQLDLLPKQDFWEHSAKIMAKLIEYELYS